MSKLLFTYKPAVSTTSLEFIRKMTNAVPVTKQEKEIENTNLVKSLLKYGNVYACHDSPYLQDRITVPKAFKTISVLHLAFAEPFDDDKMVSMIDIWGCGLNKDFATDNLMRRVNNMWDYEDLLTHYYYSDNEPDYIPNGFVSPLNQFVYHIYDPQELARYQLTQKTNLCDGSRAGIYPCGMIFTNAILNREKSR